MKLMVRAGNMVIVFQYGSNCLESEINSPRRLDGKAKFLDVAKTVANYELAFDVYAKAKNRQCGAVDILKLEISENEVVWGVLWEVPNYMIHRETAKAKGVNSLDAIEGEGINYRRRRVLVQRPNGKRLMPLTYVVINPNLQGVETSMEYAQLIINGLREHVKHGIPHEYIEKIKIIIKKNNPKIDVMKL